TLLTFSEPAERRCHSAGSGMMAIAYVPRLAQTPDLVPGGGHAGSGPADVPAGTLSRSGLPGAARLLHGRPAAAAARAGGAHGDRGLLGHRADESGQAAQGLRRAAAAPVLLP